MDREELMSRVVEILNEQAKFAPESVGFGSGMKKRHTKKSAMHKAAPKSRAAATMRSGGAVRTGGAMSHAMMVKRLMRENPGMKLGEASREAKRIRTAATM